MARSLAPRIGPVKINGIGYCNSPLALCSLLDMGLDGANDRGRGWMLALAGGVVAGTLDITYACVFWALKAGVAPQRIFQSVARGLLGAEAYQGGAATAALGLFLHYFIATSMSFAYYLVAKRWAALREQPLRYGPAYGLLLYAIMNYVVVPLSAARGGRSGGTLWIALSIVVHMFLIGLPIAALANRAFALATNEPPGRSQLNGQLS